MTLTEEQRAAIHAVSGLLTAVGCPQCHYYIRKNYTHHIEVLRAMVDSSEHVNEPTKMIGFDLENVREAVHALDNFVFASGKITAGQIQDVLWGARLLAASTAEIERLRSSLIDLHAEYINTLEKNPGCSAWDLDEQSEADQRRLRKNAAHITSTEEPLIYLQVDQQATRIKDLEADLEQAEIGIRAGMDVIDDQAAQIKELESSLDEAEALTKKNAELMNGYLGRIAELEDALVEERARGNLYGMSFEEVVQPDDEIERWIIDGEKDLPKFYLDRVRAEARRQLKEDGKIGPDAAKPRSWQITEERKTMLSHCLEVVDYVATTKAYSDAIRDRDTIRAMLEENL